MDTDGITLDSLRAFAVFAEHRNFTAAARELHLSQPALHTKVNKLANVLGTPLYQRRGRELHLTRAGLEVAEFGRRLEVDVREFAASIGATSSATPVVIAAGEGAHLHLLATGIERLLASGTPIRLLQTDSAATIDAVDTAAADIGVTVVGQRTRGLELTELASYPQLVVVPVDHPLARRRAVRLGDLDGMRLVVAPPGRPHRVALDKAMSSAGAAYEVGIEAEGWIQMMRFVSIGVGPAVINGCVDVAPGLTGRPIEDLEPVTYTVVQRRGPVSAAIASVLAVLEASVP